MSQRLADLLPAEGVGLDLRLWIKSSAYSRRLLLGESGDPWENASTFLAYFSQAQGLLKPDVAVVEVGELFDSWLQRNPAAKAELSGKRKISYPLRKLLEQSQPRELLAEVIDAVLAHLRGQIPLVLAMPAPGYWLHLVSRAIGRDDIEMDSDTIEDSAMYVADLARSVSSAAVGGLLLEEFPSRQHPEPADIELYRPLINVAKHYRWPLVLRIGEAGVVNNAALTDISAFIGSAATMPGTGAAAGVDVSAALWAGQPVPELTPTQFYFCEIPRDATPELVLDRLAGLKTYGA